MLFAAVVLKLFPTIVTVVPMGPDVGVKDVMVGRAEYALLIVFRNIETELLLLFATTKSGFPSPSTSLIAT
jgi:hypothetical protein